jgi:hypothetical protein
MAVYFIQEGADGPIKIGYSADPQQRIRQLQTGARAQLHMLRTIEGSMGVERRLHRQFAHLRLRGEWFKPEPELLAYIAGEQRTGLRHLITQWRRDNPRPAPPRRRARRWTWIAITAAYFVVAGAVSIWVAPLVVEYWYLAVVLWAGVLPSLTARQRGASIWPAVAAAVGCWIAGVGAADLARDWFGPDAEIAQTVGCALVGAWYWLGGEGRKR